MKNLMATALLIIFYVLPVQYLNAQDISWNQKAQWDEIKNEAKTKGKFIFIDCYATWCGPCKKMDKEVYTNDSVAELFNKHFISLKLQMDSTGRDNEQVKSMYGLVKDVSLKYQITGFPTLLFFTPDGVLINKELGFLDHSGLISVAKDAMSPDRLAFYKQIERYKGGERDYSKMMNLALFVQSVLGDKTLSQEIANDYIKNAEHKQLLNIPAIYFVRNVAKDRKLSRDLAKEYLATMPPDTVYTKSGFLFIADYSYMLTTSDRLFGLLKKNSSKLDSITSQSGWTDIVLGRIITKEELQDRLMRDGKAISNDEPKWNNIKAQLEQKYGFINIDKLLLDFQIVYYRSVKQDWMKWAQYKQQRINKYPPDPNNGVEVTAQLNDLGAWDAFLNCNDKTVLKKTLPWIDLAIKLTTVNPEAVPSGYMDTKANILYKIGKKDEAVKIEKKAIDLIIQYKKSHDYNGFDNELKELTEALNKMNDGLPTYLEQGAKWNSNTLPKKQDAQLSSLK